MYGKKEKRGGKIGGMYVKNSKKKKKKSNPARKSSRKSAFIS
jgi:hypothetical protein